MPNEVPMRCQRCRYLDLLLITLILASTLMRFRDNVAAEDRYIAMLADGNRIAGEQIDGWFDHEQQPQLADRSVFDASKPFRWLVDVSQGLSDQPEAYVELINGDRLPGEVIGYDAGTESTFEQLPRYLRVLSHAEVGAGDSRLAGSIRVVLSWVRRVVWRRQPGMETPPGSIALDGGGRITFRSLRWADGVVMALTEDGIQTIPFQDMVELHLPSSDVWSAYYDELATLSPRAEKRMIQIDTTDGLTATASLNRYRARSQGDPKERANWQHVLQPVWSLDPLAIRFFSIRTWRFWSPWQVPLTVIAPATATQKSLFGGSWQWRTNANIDGQPLRGGGQLFGWGFGVHATHELAFALPVSTRGFRVHVGLDRLVGDGGCAQAIVSTTQPPKPLYQSPLLIGSGTVHDSGLLSLASREGTRLILRAESSPPDRPKGADPFDIRDCVDWLDPEVFLDKGLLQKEVASRVKKSMPAWSGWTIETPKDHPIPFANVWDDSNSNAPRFAVQSVGQAGAWRLTRQWTPDAQSRWLMLCVSRVEKQSTPSKIAVRINGQSAGEFDVPIRYGPIEPNPILISLRAFAGRSVSIELTSHPDGDRPFVHWHAIKTVPTIPMLARVFEDAGKFVAQLTDGAGEVAVDHDTPYSGTASLRVMGADRANPAIESLAIPIRETPRLGEFRYIQFAWKKRGGDRICLQLARDGQWFEPDGDDDAEHPGQLIRQAPQRRFVPRAIDQRGTRLGYRYDAGRGGIGPYGVAQQVSTKLPEEWTVVTRDLYADFGDFTLTGFRFLCPDGEAAWFDHIYLARSSSDFERIKELSSDDEATE